MPQSPPLEGWESADFLENRQGRLSSAQARALRRQVDAYFIECLIFSAVWLGSAWALVSTLVSRPAVGFGIVWWVGAVPLTGLCVLVAVVGPVRTLRLRGEIAAGKVARARGAVIRIYRTPQLWYGWATIGDAKVGCWGAMWQRGWRKAITYLRATEQAREPVSAYYLPASHLLVAAEPDAAAASA